MRRTIALAQRFMRRTPADRGLLLRALVLHIVVASLLRVISFGRLSRMLNIGSRAGDQGGSDDGAIQRAVWAVRQAVAFCPLGRTCLTEALTAAVLLRRAGQQDVQLRFGVATIGARQIAAHAWLERRGTIVLGDSVQPYVTLLPVGRTM
jgi:hypothetical protein